MEFVDIHEHLLYGIDDGPSKQQGMFDMLNAAAEQGINAIIATPHVTPGVYSLDVKQYEKALAEAREYCAENLRGMIVYGGAEILYTSNTCRMLAERRVPTMAGTDMVLVEFSPDIKYEAMREALGELLSCGFRPIIAHVERYQCLTSWPPRAEKLKKEFEVYFQMNCSVALGERSLGSRMFADRMLRRKLIDALASDTHGVTKRPNRLAEAWGAIADKYGDEYANRLVNGDVLRT